MPVDKIAVIREGYGVNPLAGQKVEIHFTGYGRDGDLTKKFYSTRDQGQKSLIFTIGQGLISTRGLDEGVMEMTEGEIARLLCTPDFAYGTEGAVGFPSWGIGPNSTVIFEVELVRIDDDDSDDDDDDE